MCQCCVRCVVWPQSPRPLNQSVSFYTVHPHSRSLRANRSRSSRISTLYNFNSSASVHLLIVGSCRIRSEVPQVLDATVDSCDSLVHSTSLILVAQIRTPQSVSHFNMRNSGSSAITFTFTVTFYF